MPTRSTPRPTPLLLACTVAAAGVVTASPTAPPITRTEEGPVSLEYTWTAPGPYEYDSRQWIENTYDSNGTPQGTRLEYLRLLTFEPKSPVAGTAETNSDRKPRSIILTYGPLSFRRSDLSGEQMQTYDQVAEESNSDKFRSGFIQMQAALTDGALDLALEPTGAVRDLPNYDALVAHMVDLIEGHGNENLRLGENIKEQDMPRGRLLAELNAQYQRFPDEPVRVGDEWTIVRTREIPGYGAVRVKETYTLDRIATDADGPSGDPTRTATVMIDYDITERLGDLAPQLDRRALEVALHEPEDAGGGFVRYDLGRGLVLEDRTELYARYRIIMLDPRGNTSLREAGARRGERHGTDDEGRPTLTVIRGVTLGQHRTLVN